MANKVPDKLRKAMAKATASFKMPASQINEHDCFNWAFKVFDLIPGSLIGGHNLDGEGQCYIIYEGRCYDSETPAGTEHWFELGSFRRMMRK